MLSNRILSVSILPDNGAAEPVSLDQAKSWLIVEHTDDDTIIGDLITAVRMLLEKYTKKVFRPSTVTLELQICKCWKLPRLPIVGAITTFERWDGEAYQTVDPGCYRLLGDSIVSTPAGQIKVVYKAGYALADFPEDLRLAMKSEIVYRYENRGDKSLDLAISSTTESYISNYISYAWQ